MPVLANAKHERFAQAIAKGETIDRAYVVAGYKEHRANAARMRAKEDIGVRIEEIQSRAADRAGATIQRIAEELEHVAFADITDAVEWGEAIAVRGAAGNDDDGEPVLLQGVLLKPSDDLPKKVTAAIAEVAKTKEGIRIKFHDKLSALEKLGKFHGMFKERVDHTLTVTLADLVGESMKGEGNEK